MSPHRLVNVSKLTPGDKLVEPVFNESHTKLLGSGFALSEEFITRLAERGVRDVLVDQPAERHHKHPRRVLPSSNTHPEIVFDLTRVVEHSCHCGGVIAIHPPIADQPVAAWICKKCGAAYFGGTNTAKIRGVDLLPANDSPLASGDPTEPVDQSRPIKENASPSGSEADAAAEKNRRREKRHTIGVPVVAVPLRSNFSIAGPAVRMATRDISQSGIALAHTRFTDAPYYAIDFTAAGIKLLQVLLKVLRVSHSGPGYEVAGHFIERVHSAKWHGKCS